MEAVSHSLPEGFLLLSVCTVSTATLSGPRNPMASPSLSNVHSSGVALEGAHLQRRLRWRQEAWQAKFLVLVAKTTRRFCTQAYIDWAASRTEEIAEQVQNGNSAPLWQLARVLRARTRSPKQQQRPLGTRQICSY